MMGKTHSAAGALFTAAIAPPLSKAVGVDLSPEELGIGVAIGYVAGLLPDIDHPNSMLTEGIVPGAKRLGPLGPLLGFFLSIPPRLVGVGARMTMNHRGGTHSLTFLLLWTVLAAPLYALVAALGALIASIALGALTGIVPGLPQIDVGAVVGWLVENTPKIMPLVSISVFCGYLSHLVADSMTKVPVPWPWPFSKRRIFLLPKPLRITTDSEVENKIIRPIVWLLFAAFFALNVAIPTADQLVNAGQKRLDQQENKQSKPKPKPQPAKPKPPADPANSKGRVVPGEKIPTFG